jgi:hypothetical protein
MMKSSTQETKGLILGYLKRFPEAKDTPEGIADWWIDKNMQEVAIAIRELLRENIICEMNLGSTKVYGLKTVGNS